MTLHPTAGHYGCSWSKTISICNLALKVFCQSLGYRAWFAVDVASALDLAGTRTFDVLLSDIGLPDGDGWELRRRLVEAGRCPPHSIAMSSDGSCAHVVRCQEAGFARYLVKPFAPEVLMQALEEFTSAPEPGAPRSLVKRPHVPDTRATRPWEKAADFQPHYL